MAREGKYIPVGAYQGRSIGILTSGGDSQGMNAAVKSAVRMSIYCGATVYFIFEGLQGLVDGGLNIHEAYWSDVSGMINQGGTVIGSARCLDFRDRAGRLKAAKNLIDRDIMNLVVIGGDGSLTGANIFKQEWISYLDELIARKVIDPMKKRYCERLNIVGLVGSIDNDFCGTDMTIGADSALARIMESTDALITTAHSHQRCFIIEVMGRHCGYLALITALSSEAQFVFIPEKPPGENWQEELCNRLLEAKRRKNRVNLVILSEGAIDYNNQPITAEAIKKLISEQVKMDTRITVLGHVQRGGNPTAFDRILGLRQGAEAILALIDASNNPSLPACVICITKNNICRKPLMDCIKKTQELQALMNNGDFEDLLKMRGQNFFNNYHIYETLNRLSPPTSQIEDLEERNIRKRITSRFLDESDTRPRVGIICAGTAACGMNSAIRSVVRTAITNDMHPIAIKQGFEGFMRGDVTSISWGDVRGIIATGGCVLGTRRITPDKVGFDKLAEKFREFKLAALVIIGGFEAFLTGLQLYQNKDQYPEFRIPIPIIPCAISNNIPGIQFSIGNDTALNVMVNQMDALKIGSTGCRYRIYIVETMGNYSGYLNTMAALAGGADLSYIDEEPLDIGVLNDDVNVLKAKMLDDVEYGIVLRTNVPDHPYDSQYIFKLFKQEGHDIFDCRHNSFGHVTLGGRSTSFDRNHGTKYGVESVLWIKNFFEYQEDNNVVMVGLPDNDSKRYSPVQIHIDNIDYKKCCPLKLWWMNLRPLLRIIQTHESMYDSSNIMKIQKND